MTQADAVPPYLNSDTAAAHLRSVTAERHRLVEEKLDVPALLKTRRGYTSLLAYFAACVGPVERWVDAHPQSETLPARPRSLGFALLQADLRTVGAEANLAPSGSTWVFDGESVEHLLGALYVVEGSALGGMAIAKMARRSLGVTASTGASFFLRNAADPLGPWNAFKQILNARTRTESQRAGAAAAATAAFEHFLRQPLPPVVSLPATSNRL
ncbi:biliverdin-producing heme oxygenase [Alienimonas chondri]|uniref:Heme oxygenase n=1 Tax=Alienimonas chondri TaxID=2681879 RepID=A0ABX1V7X4_9PLAN|nr:biliverdin-producing heme oxygenase [Alienimonas chondri]NNJ24298.1 hypothetical protein [Alienimonas chondri]